ncbi:hypothetical protein FRC05_011295, partial [Tulasnella sp. 425]
MAIVSFSFSFSATAVVMHICATPCTEQSSSAAHHMDTDFLFRITLTSLQSFTRPHPNYASTTQISTKSNHFQQRSASCQVKTELQEWRASPSQKPLHSAVDLGTVKHEIDVWADASSYGIGILIDDHFLAWKYCLKWNGWGKDGYDIGWAETIGLELAIRCLVASNLSDANFLVHNDNAGAIEA